MHIAYIGIGANLQDPVGQVRKAFVALATLDATRLAAQSSLYRTTPVGYAEQPDFVNAVARIETGLEALAVLGRLLAIEQLRGRKRTRPNGPRALDLDLLLFDDVQFDSERLIVPHPRMHERAFVLIPLLEIAPEVVIPGHGAAADLLAKVGRQGVERIPE